ncbi:MAG: PspC domain-containing protein [Chitinophagales bacterium]|nr:PspC domain-containing protein [Chitinophagales bacterium]MDW8273119.1 PspC domain-containing protein [Chitinophagales bacterium]
MKKTVNINLAGIAFVIDEDAYELLHTYLESISKKFSDLAGKEEIIQDIETRLAELFNRELDTRKEVISLADVRKAIDQMGTPEDIAGEVASESRDTATAQTAASAFKKRLYRDKDNMIIAGVISGLCHYFGIGDPVWARIAAVLLVIAGFGFPIILYIVLMFIVPEANTPTEKLQMRGEPINLENLEREIKESAKRASDTLKNTVSNSRIRSFFKALGSILIWTIKLVVGFVALIFALVVVALLAGIFGVSVAGNHLLTEAPEFFINDKTTSLLLKFGLVLFVGAPALILIYSAIRFLFRIKERIYWLRTTLAAAWLVGLIMLLLAFSRIGDHFQQKGTYNYTISHSINAANKYEIQILDEHGRIADPDEELNVRVEINEGIMINEKSVKDWDEVPIGEPTLYLVPASTDSLRIQVQCSARSKTKKEAKLKAQNVICPIRIREDKIVLPAYYYISSGEQWRAQDTKIYIELPQNDTIIFPSNIGRLDIRLQGEEPYEDEEMANTSWTNTSGQIRCVVCPLSNASRKNKEQEI